MSIGGNLLALMFTLNHFCDTDHYYGRLRDSCTYDEKCRNSEMAMNVARAQLFGASKMKAFWRIVYHGGDATRIVKQHSG